MFRKNIENRFEHVAESFKFGAPGLFGALWRPRGAKLAQDANSVDSETRCAKMWLCQVIWRLRCQLGKIWGEASRLIVWISGASNTPSLVLHPYGLGSCCLGCRSL